MAIGVNIVLHVKIIQHVHQIQLIPTNVYAYRDLMAVIVNTMKGHVYHRKIDAVIIPRVLNMVGNTTAHVRQDLLDFIVKSILTTVKGVCAKTAGVV